MLGTMLPSGLKVRVRFALQSAYVLASKSVGPKFPLTAGCKVLATSGDDKAVQDFKGLHVAAIHWG